MTELESERLISVLSKPRKTADPVVLPDFFVDHFVKVGSFDEFMKGLSRLVSQGGGNLLGNTQFVRRGGNAVNVASALLSLGLSPHVIVTTDDYGLSLLKALADPRFDLSHVHTDGRMSATVSVEAEYEGRQVNLMISDSGSASCFGFSDLTAHDLKAVRESGLVAVVNLNHNAVGSELVNELFTHVRKESTAITFIDIGDPSNRPELLAPLVQGPLQDGLVDFVSVNENECIWLAKTLSDDESRCNGSLTKPETWRRAAVEVSTRMNARLLLHTPYYSAMVEQDSFIGVPTLVAKQEVICGAGDVWNAAVIWGLLQDLRTEDILLLANATAALYVSSPDAAHPSRQDTVRFLSGPLQFSKRGNNLLKLE
ncbi:MAG: carbohydrate kinase family protein [Candidatus Thorarchaeota archaeon]